MRFPTPIGLLLAAALAAHAETHTLTLAQAAALAAQQNPDVLLARLEAQQADLDIKLAQDPFIPKVYVGSGLAYTNGFPMSVEGSAPSIFQARAVASLYDRSQKLKIAQSKEDARGAAIRTESRREDAVARTVELFLDASHARQSLVAAQQQAESAARLEQLTRARVDEGREIPLEAKRAALDSAKARQLAARFGTQAGVFETTLASVLGYPPGDAVVPTRDALLSPDLPSSETAAVDLAERTNPDLRRIESNIVSQQLAARSARATRLPKLNLIAQYGLFAKFNNYEDYFRTFQRHNGQLGMSVELPLSVGPAASAQAARAQTEIDRLRLEANRLRSQIAVDVRRDFANAQEAEIARDVARLDLDVARDSIDVVRAQVEEGRASLRDLELARQLESQKWLAYYDAIHALDRARFALAHRTGTLAASLK
jgi:outer membrane protein TolC